MSHLLFGPEVRYMLVQNDAGDLRTFCETLHPATVAETLAEGFSAEEVWRVLQTTPIKHQAAVFEYFPIERQVQLVKEADQHIARLIEQMSHDDRADLLRKLKPAVAENLLRLVDEADRRDIATLVRYPENTAGALMTTDYAWLPENVTVAEAIDRLRLQAPDRETIYYVYVLDEGRRLLGIVSLRQLILAAREELLRDVMEREVVAVRATDDGEVVAAQLARYDLLAIPVTDEVGRLVGIVTHDDVIDVVVQEATEDVHRLGAVGPIGEGYLQASFLRVWRTRAFWLGTLFLTGMLTFQAMAHYNRTLETVAVLSLFVPLCISTGGNSGSQAATMITRALALGQVTLSDWLRVIRHELLMGLTLGVTLAVLGCLRALIVSEELLANKDGTTTDRWTLALVIALSVAGICVCGTLVGALLPLVFKRVGIDPAIASNPFIATFVDVTGIVIYFTIASTLLLH